MGLMDYKARMYDGYLSRFIQPDSIIPNAADPQSWNRYSYVQNNPIAYNDPTGHEPNYKLRGLKRDYGRYWDDVKEDWHRRGDGALKEWADRTEADRATAQLKSLLQRPNNDMRQMRNELAFDPAQLLSRAFGGGKGLLRPAGGGNGLWRPAGESCFVCMLEFFEGMELMALGGMVAVGGAAGLVFAGANAPGGLVAAPSFAAIAVVGADVAFFGYQIVAYTGTERKPDPLGLVHIFFPQFIPQ